MATAVESSGSFTRALAGQYEVIREIGRGGMGVVFLARDLKLDRDVAIKTLPAQLANEPTVRARFLHEARTAAALSHPNIVPIHRADEIDGHVFFVMGYVDGESLAQRVWERGPLAMGNALRLLRDVAGALGYAHAHGVVHRDVKAENILIERETNRAMVTDFGIARFAEAAPLTATGQVLGSVHYMSPEQVSGLPLDGRSDLYSLGIAGFFAMTGRFPFESEIPSAILVAHVNTPAPRFRDVAPLAPAPVASLIDRCLTKQVAARYPAAADLVHSIDQTLARIGADGELVGVRDMPAVISEAEAQHVWQRASELQSVTSARAEVRLPRLRPRTRLEGATLTSGYRLGDVRDAALEAGIAPEYVERALEEHGLAFVPREVRRQRKRRAPREGHEKRVIDPVKGIDKARGQPGLLVHERPRPVDPLLRAPTRLVFDATVEAEMPERDFDILLDVIRRRTGEVGQVSAIGRALGWSVNTPDRNVQLSVVARHGQTAIHVEEDLKSAAQRLASRVMAGGWVLGASVFLISVPLGNPLLGIGAWSGIVLSSYAFTRAWYESVADRRRAQLREMVDAVVRQISTLTKEQMPVLAREDGPKPLR
jgi:eukaryotic-like serine/threonine-protein kinase